jgi:hypothetical protein
MTPLKSRELRKLYAMPYDIEKRQRRIEQLEALQSDGPQSASDVVKSSSGEGNACILSHATVTGTDVSYTRREDEIKRLRQINADQKAKYLYGQRLIENCDDCELRALLTAICSQGKKPQEVAVELMEQGVDIGAEAIRCRVNRWIQKKVEK